MARSRLEKLGTVFSRTRNLLRSGVLSEAQKPLWLDVYAAFPPLREPIYRKPQQQHFGKVKDVIAPILYQEDKIRVKFFDVYGNGPIFFELSQLKFKSTCQRFVEKYNELQKEGKIEMEKLFEETEKQLFAEGILLRRKQTTNVVQQTVEEAKTMVLEINSQTLLEEREEEKQDQEDKNLESTDVEKENPLPY